MLEDHRNFAAGRTQLCRGHGVKAFAVDNHLAAGGALKQVDAAHQCAFTGAAHTDDPVDVAIFDRQGDVLERVHPAGSGFKCLTDML